ncbi:MAG: hypothetical protein KGI29_03385 [Pseudomonadota bacterium]|nr:hypothetical protein [Pseudomonadota bacterium]
MRRYKGRLVALALAILLPAAAPAWADEPASVPVVYGEIIRDHARITFEWPQPVTFTASAKGKRVAIVFDHAANPNFGALLTRLYPYVTSAERKGDGKTIVLTLDKPYRIRTFVSDNINGIELLKITPAFHEEAKKLAALSPAAGAPAPASAAAAVPKTPAVAAALPNDSAALPPGDAVKIAPPARPADIKVNVSASDDSATLRFEFNDRTALAAFIRSNVLWVVFNKSATLDLSDFNTLPRTVIDKAELLKDAPVTVLRIPVEDNVYASVAKEQGSYEWAVLLTSVPRALSSVLKIAVNTDPPIPPYVFVPALEMADPVTLQDPLIGDTLVVVPLFTVGLGMPMTRTFVEFSLARTAQGVVIDKKADAVTVEEARDGLRVSMPQGAALTPGLPEVAPTLEQTLQTVPTLFPYAAWTLGAAANRGDTINNLVYKIITSATVQAANEARLRLAQIYLSEGLAAEAIGMLENIDRANPAYYRSARLAAMRGAANFLMYRFADAARDFSASELNNNKEVEYWRNMLSDLLGNPEGNYDYLALNADYISKYPPPFRQRLAIVSADRAIDAKDYNMALKIFDTLHADKLLGAIDTYVNFLLAKIAAATGQDQQATDMWDKLAEDYAHPFVQARAEFSRIAWGMDHNTLTKNEAIDRLERLRLAWHGDSLEQKVLGLLGDLYAEKKDYVNAMRVWNDGVSGFPNTASAIAMSHKMEEAFITMFNDGAADRLPPIDALALYYQYRNFAPSGDTGREITGRLADRLASVDLLEQAAALLDHQMQFESEKEQRSHIGARLASIYLLNHQPKQALTALENSMYGNNPDPLRMKRNRLAAQALSDLGQSDKALQILSQDDSPEAERVRLGVYWHEKDWPHVVASVEGMLKARPDVTAPVTLDESEYLIKLALAYAFENNTVQLQYLHDYFGPLMAKNPNKPMFDFITAADVTPTPTNFDEVIKNLAETQSFFDHYKAHVQLAGLDAIPAAGKTAPPPPKTSVP